MSFGKRPCREDGGSHEMKRAGIDGDRRGSRVGCIDCLARGAHLVNFAETKVVGGRPRELVAVVFVGLLEV